MELDLQSLFGLLYTAVLIDSDPATPPPPHLGSYTRPYWSAKIDDISLNNPLILSLCSTEQERRDWSPSL
jgi:hypothetical protein